MTHSKKSHPSKSIRRFPRGPWKAFHSYGDFKNAGPISFAIDGFLQNGACTMIGGLSGHGKTLIMLSMVKALLAGPGTKLWGHFPVTEVANRVVYLIPESGIEPFKHRLEAFGLMPHLKEGRLLVTTLSHGTTPELDNPEILDAANGGHVFLDTAIRFSEGEESKASDNQNGLAKYIFGLLRANARSVVGAHHSPKNFDTKTQMTLENILRGTGDIGAMTGTVWGIKQLDKTKNIIHVENVKPRDFEPCGPFQIIGRPYINETGDFRMHKKPGECGTLAEEMGANGSKVGRPESEEKARNKELLAKMLEKNSKLTSTAIVKKFAKRHIKIAPQTVRKHRKELRSEVQAEKPE